ncbi:MAG: triose-phosphate isomerase [Mogibacterium sp.]|nr:triose-phosphate isomerase [Mogibacterium sp.]
MEKFLIAGNWKMNKTTREAVAFAEELKACGLANEDEVAIMAPFTQLAALKDAFAGTGIRVGAQNVHFAPSGAYTGEISVAMLSEIGVDFCVVGHSERREYFAETDETVNLKLKALLAGGITPILCVGESLEIRNAGNAQTFVSGQICADYEGIPAEDAERIVIAYEPIWAIGTGVTATPEQAQEMCEFIRGMMCGLYGEAVGNNILIQYGGSMKPGNARDLLSKPDINGGLIGGASLDVKGFAEIAKFADEIQK